MPSDVAEATPVPTPIPDDLLAFAWFPPDLRTHLLTLAAKALEERWDDPTEPEGNLTILSSYIRHTFKRIVEEKKVEFRNDLRPKLGAWNTGLFTEHYEPIYACFEENRNPGRQPWVFKEWAIPADHRMRRFDHVTIKAARYFDNPADLVYEPDLPLLPNLDHILIDHLDRFPPEFREDSFKRRLALAGAIPEAGKRAQMNWRTAVPQYYSPAGGHGHVQLLLPLRLTRADKIDLALVVERQELVYRAYTVLPLNLAYKNARLIGRQETEWLGTSKNGPNIKEPAEAD